MNISIAGYQMNYKRLTKEVFERDNLGYKKALCHLKMYEATKGMIANSVLKPSKSGTLVNYKSPQDEETYKTYCEALVKEKEDLDNGITM